MQNFGLYVIVTRPTLPLRKIASICVRTGIRCLQLREKHLTDREVLQSAAELLAVTRGTRTLVFINDRVDLALAAGADGVHLGQDDLPLETARHLAAGSTLRFGLSTHSLAQAHSALAQAPDYIGFGPIYPTPTKAKPDPVVGVDRLRTVLQFADRPVVAIGGIDAQSLDPVLKAGAQNVCLVRYLMETPDLEKRIRTLQARLSGAPRSGS